MKRLPLHMILGAAMVLLVVGCTKDPDDTIPEEEIQIPVDQRGVVYASDASSKFEIWKLEGETSTQLTRSEDSDAWWPRHSQATGQVLYYSSKGSRDINDYTSADLKVMNIDGTDQQTLISSGDHEWEQQGLANWSHDGSSIVLCAQEKDAKTWQIFVTNNEGKDPQRISLRDGVDYLDPIFDVGDESILCITVPEGEVNDERNFEVIRLHLDGREERLTNNDRRDQHPALSIDGGRIVYESLVDPEYLSIGKWSLMEVDLSSGNESQVLDDNHINLFPRYSFDGTYVIYTRLNIESFAMTLCQVDVASGETSLMISEEGHSMNADPY